MKITSIEKTENIIHINKTENYFSKSILNVDCGEIAMSSYDSCRLIALNLFNFVDNPFKIDADFDFDKFYKITYEAMRLSDDLVDLELEYVQRIIDKIKSDPESNDIKRRELELWKKIYDNGKAGRRTGLGFTALGDMLAALNLGYDSEAGLDFVEKVMRTKMEAELDATIDMAIFRGTFLGWNIRNEFLEDVNGIVRGRNDYYQYLIEEFPIQTKRMFGHGRRNVSWSTVAPTGTISAVAQVTSGLEPLFQPFYIRRKKINPNDKNVRVDFVDEMGDSWTEYPVIHPKFHDWIEMMVEYNIDEEYDISNKEFVQKWFKKSPWYKSTANEINWIQRVRMQSIIQSYISHSLSSTLNLPQSATQKDIAQIYMKAWEMGLKGVTVYRDGSRSGVLITETEKIEKIDERPDSIECDIYHNQHGGNKFTTLIGLNENGSPIEVFCLPGTVASNYDKGHLIKKGKGVYALDTAIDEKFGVFPDITDKMPGEWKNLCIAWSYCLRYGMPVDKLVRKIGQVNEPISAFSKVIARNLSKYMDGEVAKGFACPNCKEEAVIFEEGCKTCKNCGWSAC